MRRERSEDEKNAQRGFVDQVQAHCWVENREQSSRLIYDILNR